MELQEMIKLLNNDKDKLVLIDYLISKLSWEQIFGHLCKYVDIIENIPVEIPKLKTYLFYWLENNKNGDSAKFLDFCHYSIKTKKELDRKYGK